MNEKRTIRVTGKGRLKVRPDTTRITLTLEGSDPDYGKVLERSARDTETVRDLLTGFGFARSDLKTLSFDVDTEYESYREKGVYKQRFKGYRFTHLLKTEFPSDNDRLGRILFALARCPAKPEFRLSYTVSDPEGVKNTLLGRAVSDAGEKAAVLTRAAGVALKDILRIDYSWGEIDLEVRSMDRMLLEESDSTVAATGSYDLDVEPDDIEVTDTVTVLWEIG